MRLWVALLGLVAAMTAFAQVPQAAGHLQPSGGYRTPLHGGTVNLLPDGSIFIYGYGMASNEWRTQQDQNNALRQRHGMESGPDPAPKLYDPARRGWLRIPRAPDCRLGNAYLHTSTVLRDGRVLIAGGLCDVAKALNDPSPSPPYDALSVWDPATRHWQAAPALTQPRIFHTATLMPDDSVLLIGGEGDPKLSQGEGEPVLSSVVRYAHGKLAAGPSMVTARAKHSATVLPDGSLLVAGGVDADGRPIASAELLNAQGTAWQALPPMHVARYAHTATLLGDGRVLVAGGMGQDGRPLRSVETWDPVTGKWTEAADLPVGLYGHAAIRLASGDVLVAGGTWLPAVQGQSMPWAWLWSPLSQSWQLAGHTASSDGEDASDPVSLAAQPDGSVLIFTSNGVLHWLPGPVPDDAVPAWQSPPAVAKLPRNRLMMVGYLADDFRGIPVARIWDAASDHWSDAGALNPGSATHPVALALPSGDVLYLTLKLWHGLQCQLWKAADNSWSPCGTERLQYLTGSRPQSGLLPDGRAFAIVNLHEAAVYDQASARWAIWRVDWHEQGLSYGAPVHGQQPLTTLTDPASGERFEANAAGARFLHVDSRRATAMLWNAKTGWWDYVMMGRHMGADAQHLPDGCALSTNPIALYRPSDAQVFPLSDPGMGSRNHEMVIMDDGTVVVVGPGRGTLEPGAGFFHRKATCAGFAPPPAGDRYISPTVPMAPITPPSAQAHSVTPARSQRQWLTSWRSLVGLKWLILACVGPWLAYRLLRRVPWPRLTGARSLAMRLLVYGTLAIVLMPWVLSLSTCVGRIPSERWQQAGSAIRKAAHSAMTPSRRPCNLVGLWSSTRKGITRRIELKDDGRYVMLPSVFDAHSSASFTGHWAVQASNIVWKDDRSHMVDTNPMLEVSDGRFQVIEADGSHTQFERIEAKASAQCDKP